MASPSPRPHGQQEQTSEVLLQRRTRAVIERIPFRPDHEEVGRKIRTNYVMKLTTLLCRDATVVFIGQVLLPYGHLVVGAGSSLAGNRRTAALSSGEPS